MNDEKMKRNAAYFQQINEMSISQKLKMLEIAVSNLTVIDFVECDVWDLQSSTHRSDLEIQYALKKYEERQKRLAEQNETKGFLNWILSSLGFLIILGVISMIVDPNKTFTSLKSIQQPIFFNFLNLISNTDH